MMDFLDMTDEQVIAYAKTRSNPTELETELAERLRRALAEIDQLLSDGLPDDS